MQMTVLSVQKESCFERIANLYLSLYCMKRQRHSAECFLKLDDRFIAKTLKKSSLVTTMRFLKAEYVVSFASTI